MHEQTHLREQRPGKHAGSLQATIDLPAEVVMRDSQVIDRVIEVFFEHWGLGMLEVCVRPAAAQATKRGEPRPAIELAGYQFAFLLATQGFDSS